MSLSDEAFRQGLLDVLERSGRSRRQLSAALGRDPGYVAALLDPTRKSRARPTPDDLIRASDLIGVPFIELLERLWGIDRGRLASELEPLVAGELRRGRGAGLSERDRASLADYAAFLAARSRGPG